MGYQLDYITKISQQRQAELEAENFEKMIDDLQLIAREVGGQYEDLDHGYDYCVRVSRRSGEVATVCGDALPGEFYATYLDNCGESTSTSYKSLDAVVAAVQEWKNNF